MEITVVDAIMGSGKTSAAINYMEEHSDDMRFLYITPYLEETKRIRDACTKCNFQLPGQMGSKLKSVKQLLSHGCNVASTHALFGFFDKEVLSLISRGNYVLIMDEAYDVVNKCKIPRNVWNIIKNVTNFDPTNGIVKWNGNADSIYASRFHDFKKIIDSGTVVGLKVIDGNTSYENLFSVIPAQSFLSFSSVFILTYMFDGSIQKAYFDFFGFEYKIIGVEHADTGYRFGPANNQKLPIDLHKLIHIWESKKANQIGEHYKTLTYSWYESHKGDSERIIQLKKNIINFYRNVTKTKTSENMWTTYKFARNRLSGAGYTKGFVEHNARATNAHKDRRAIVYTINKFMNPEISRFFLARGVSIDQDKYALSSMIQFIWRSAIRDGKEIYIYIPSRRMRYLLKRWMKEVSTE